MVESDIVSCKRNIGAVSIGLYKGNGVNDTPFKYPFSSDGNEAAIERGNKSDHVVEHIEYSMDDEGVKLRYYNCDLGSGVHTLVVPTDTAEKARWLTDGLVGVLSEYFDTKPVTRCVDDFYTVTAVGKIAVIVIADNRVRDSKHLELNQVITDLVGECKQHIVVTGVNRLLKKTDDAVVDTGPMDRLKKVTTDFTVAKKNLGIAAAKLITDNPQLTPVLGYRIAVEHPSHNTLRYVFTRKKNRAKGILSGHLKVECRYTPYDDMASWMFDIVNLVASDSRDLLDTDKFDEAQKKLIGLLKDSYVSPNTVNGGYEPAHFAIGGRRFIISDTDEPYTRIATHLNSYIRYTYNVPDGYKIVDIKEVYLG